LFIKLTAPEQSIHFRSLIWPTAREAAADQGMPNHGSLSANETLVGNCGSAWTCKELALSPPR
jgi:hypothetical protein